MTSLTLPHLVYFITPWQLRSGQELAGAEGLLPFLHVRPWSCPALFLLGGLQQHTAFRARDAAANCGPLGAL